MKRIILFFVLAVFALAVFVPMNTARADEDFYTVRAGSRALLFSVSTPCRERVRTTKTFAGDSVYVTIERGEARVMQKYCRPSMRTRAVVYLFVNPRFHGYYDVYINGAFFARMRL